LKRFSQKIEALKTIEPPRRQGHKENII